MAGSVSSSERLKRGTFVFLTTADLGVQNGPSVHVLNLVNALAGYGYDVVLLAPLPREPLILKLDDSVRLEFCADTRRLGLPGGAANALLLLNLWRHRRADVIYIRSSPGSIIATAFAWSLRPKRLGVEFNGWIADEAAMLGSLRPLAGVLARFQVWEAKLADRVRTVTAELANRVVRSGVSEDRVMTIPTGTRLETFRPMDKANARLSLGLPLGDRIAVFVGNLWPAIDLGIIADAAKLLHESGLPLSVLIVGDGPARAGFEAKLRQVFAGDCPVRLLGSLSMDNAATALAAGDIAIAPFVRERNEAIGLSPLKIRDYAACGKVIVATALPGILDFAAEPWLFTAPPEDAAAFADAIRTALASDRETAGKAARAYAEKHFGWAGVAANLGALMDHKSDT